MGTLAFVFPGQASQHVGMGKELANAYPEAAAAFAEADTVLGFSLSALCFAGPEAELTATVNAQPALLTVSIAALRAWQAAAPLPAPAFAAGHSMGEYSALVAAGALTFADGLRLLRERGRLMQRAGDAEPGQMAAVLGLGRAELAQACQQASDATGQIVGIANDNAPGQIVISGHVQAVQQASELAKAAGAKRVVPLAVSVASHSPLMQPAVDDFRRAVDATPMTPPAVPVVSNVTAQPLTDVAAVRAELVAQLTSPVRWVESVAWMAAQGADTFIEIGPGAVLRGLIKRIAPDARLLSVADSATLHDTILATRGVTP